MQKIVAALFFLCVFTQTSFSEAVTNSTLFTKCNPPPRCPSKNIPLYIQGFVAATNEVYSSETIIPAAFAAIDDINGNCSILPDYYLQLEFVNTQCSPSQATWNVINSIALNDNNQKFLFLGGGCSLDTEPLAAMAGRFYQVPFLSYGASSPFLSERALFPTFFRTIPSETQSNSARFAIMKSFGWRKVATLHQTELIFSETVDDFHRRYGLYFGNKSNDSENGEDDDLTLRSFTEDPNTSLDQIKKKDIRIIIGFFYENVARITLCQAYHRKLTTANHVWMLPAWYSSDWYNTTKHNKENVNCTVDQMIEAVQYALYFDSYNFGVNKTAPSDIGSATAKDFDMKYSCYLEEFKINPIFSDFLDSDSDEPHDYRTFTYDGVWTMAFALDNAEKELGVSLTNLTYFGNSSVSEVVTRYMSSINFVGISGDVSFDINGSRIGLNAVYQLMKNEKGQLNLEPLFIHDPNSNIDQDPNQTSDNECPSYFLQCFHNEPQWKGGVRPHDRRRPINRYLSEHLVGFFAFIILISILVATTILIFTLATIKKPLIRDSAPHINTIITIGCIVMLVTCILLGVDSSNPDTDEYVKDENEDNIISETEKAVVLAARDRRYAIICMLRLWFLTLGFTFSFGALFAKTYQIYHIYANPGLKATPFKMWNFLIIMCVLLAIDVSYLSFWTGYDPFTRELASKVDSGNEELIIFEKCSCRKFPYLIGALFVYKGLLALFGLFLAYESRNVKYIYINDSRFVSITMYIVVILVGIGAPLSLVLADHSIHNAAYALSVLTIVGSCMSCLLILTVPKFVYMAKGKETMVRVKSQDEINVPGGLQLERRKSNPAVLDQPESNGKPDADSTDAAKDQAAESADNEKQAQLQQNSQLGSDKDSGVLVTTGDENDTFSSSNSNGDNQVGSSKAPDSDKRDSASMSSEREAADK